MDSKYWREIYKAQRDVIDAQQAIIKALTEELQRKYFKES